MMDYWIYFQPNQEEHTNERYAKVASSLICFAFRMAFVEDDGLAFDGIPHIPPLFQRLEYYTHFKDFALKYVAACKPSSHCTNERRRFILLQCFLSLFAVQGRAKDVSYKYCTSYFVMLHAVNDNGEPISSEKARHAIAAILFTFRMFLRKF